MNGLKRTPAQILERAQLAKDLEYLVKEDKDIREELMDEYVYMLNDKRVEELQGYVLNELRADY